MDAPSTFRRMMDQLMGHMHFVKLYPDDVLIFLQNCDEPLSHLEKVVALIPFHALRIKFFRVYLRVKPSFFCVRLQAIGAEVDLS